MRRRRNWARYNPQMSLSLVPPILQELAHRIEARGGRALLVGGAVIDLLHGREPKDWDIEVYGHSYDSLVRMTQQWGLDPKTVGKSFGIVKVVVGDYDVDLNVPRRENRVGVGHKGFDVSFDPNMTPREAARRRDFTINAMAVDLNTGDLVDPFGGLNDLKTGTLRATDPRTFVEDPLRALRAMQLLARKAKKVDPATMRLIQSMVDEFPYLSKERVYEEFRKLLLKAKKPSTGLEFLRRSGWIQWFPELLALTVTPQRPGWHDEGSVWNHTLLVVNAAARVRDTLPPQDREPYMFAALLHDVGKPGTTILDPTDPEMYLTSHGHDASGADVAENFLRRMTNNKKLIDRVRVLVGLHMQPYSLVQGQAKHGAYARLARKLDAAGATLRDLAYISMADKAGSVRKGDPFRKIDPKTGLPSWEHRPSTALFEYAERFEREGSLIKPTLQGRDLIALGYRPGPAFGKALKAAFEHQLDHPDAPRSKLLEIAVASLEGKSSHRRRQRRR